MKVLIVDDNESITEVVKDFFEFENIECKTINDSQDGLNEIKNSKYDLILLDIAMPNFTGLDILNELKRQKLNTKTLLFLPPLSSNQN
jgi:DNA-binding response OmpR family regulator